MIPAQGEEIAKVKILARKIHLTFFVIDEVDVSPGEATIFPFRNDRITKGVPESEGANKQFDNLPRKAQSQTVASNRLMYGNYLDGYDNVTTSCVATLQYADRPKDFVDLNIKVKPALSLHGGGQKSTGFELDFSEIPDVYSTGDTVNFTIAISPEGNWHLYNFSGNETSYHQTRLVGAVEQEAPDGLIDGLNEEIGLFIQEADTAGEVYLAENDFAFGSGGACK